MATSHLPLTPSQVESWRDIARACAAVITFCQRPSGFWATPTNEDEVKWYFEGDTNLAFGDYDRGSYTITWYCLLALEKLYGTCPWAIIQGVQRVLAQNPPIEGAYGKILSPGARTADAGIDPSARHTAFALLIRLRFLTAFPTHYIMDSVEWLLGARTERGGWSYRIADKRTDEAFSTGVSVAALSYFLTTMGDGLSADRRLQIENAITVAFERLLTLRDETGLWKGHLPGEKDVPDSAKVIELLSLPQVLDHLERLSPQLVCKFQEVKATLKSKAKQDGWAARLVPEAETSTSATVNALPAVFHLLLDSSEIERQYLCAVCAALAHTLFARGDRARLESADWALLGRISAEILVASGNRALSENERKKIEDAVVSVRAGKYFFSKAMRLVLSELPPLCSGSVLYLLSAGKQNRGAMVLPLTRASLQLLPYLQKCLSKRIMNGLRFPRNHD